MGVGLCSGARPRQPVPFSAFGADSGRWSVNSDFGLLLNPYPAALDDSLAVYRALIEDVDADQVVVCRRVGGGGTGAPVAAGRRDASLADGRRRGSDFADARLHRVRRRVLTSTATRTPSCLVRPWLDALSRMASGRDPAWSIRHCLVMLPGCHRYLYRSEPKRLSWTTRRQLAERVEAPDGERTGRALQGVMHMWHSFANLPEAAEATERAGIFARNRTTAQGDRRSR